MAHVQKDRVRDTSTTTGTGAFTVSGSAPTGYRTFSAVCSVSDTVDYLIAHQSAAEWETGIGTYSASNQLTRTQVLDSSNSGSAVSFSAGTKDVVLSPIAGRVNRRETLFADRTYYVRTDGSNSNTGLANTAGGAFLTIQKAWDTILTIDLNGFTVTIKLGNSGTFTGGLYVAAAPTGGSVVLEGDTVTPANTIISTTSDHCVYVGYPTGVTVQYLEMRTTTSGMCLYADGGGAAILMGAGLRFGACAQNHIYASTGGAIYGFSNYTITGSAGCHIQSQNNGIIAQYGQTVTVSGTPAFSNAFAWADTGGITSAGAITYSGAATGARYQAYSNGIIQTFGAGATYFPGNAAGTGSTTNTGYYF